MIIRRSPTPLRLRRLASLAVVTALVVQLVAPVHAFGANASGGPARVPVCTAAGIVWQPLDGVPVTPAGAPARLAAKCLFCLLHASPAALPAIAAVMFRAPQPAAQPSRPSAEAPRAAPVPVGHLCRAPPATA